MWGKKMKSFVSTVVGASMLFAASSANAASVLFTDIVSGDVPNNQVITDIVGEDLTISFIFNQVAPQAFTAFAEFQVDFDSTLALASFDQPGTSGQSGFTLDLLGLLGSPDTRLTTASTACNGAASPVGGTCDLINSNSADPDVALFDLLAGSSYRLGFQESGAPNEGTAVFEVTSTLTPVPLPAGLVLLFSGIGVFGLLRRRRTA